MTQTDIDIQDETVTDSGETVPNPENENENGNENSDPVATLDSLNSPPISSDTPNEPGPGIENSGVVNLALPTPDLYRVWVLDKMAKGQVAEITATGTSMEIQTGKTETTWSGNPSDVTFIGYPFIASDETKDEDGAKMLVPRLLETGFPLKVLYWSDEHHAFCCVRSDIYVN